MKAIQTIFFFLICSRAVNAQSDSSYLNLGAYIHLDSIMITAKRQGFSVNEYIDLIQSDSSLETSFNNLRMLSYSYENDIKFHNNKQKITASYTSNNEQNYNGECQWMKVDNEVVYGNYFKKNKRTYNYYTSNLYHRVFYQSKQPCDKRAAVEPKLSRANKVLENRIKELKKLIYNPGQQADIPLIGDKTAIFSPEMIDHYNFSLESGQHKSGKSVYIFKATIKPLFNSEHPNGSVVKYLEVQTEKYTNQVLSRKYKLQYNAGVYRFDILMLVDLEKHKGKYIPSDIKYDGYWKVVGKRKENCTFHFKINEFN